MANTQHIDCYAGENRTQTLYARNYLNVPVNLTGKTISWSLARAPNTPDCLQGIVTYAGTIVSASAGSYTIPIAPGDTANLTPGNYYHQTNTTDGTGSVQIVNAGRFRLRSLVTPESA